MLNEHYSPEVIERQVQQDWEKQQAFKAKEDINKEKFYCLCMFPYPSGQLHMGHVRNYTIGDVIARYQRMRGKNVLQPMGWDAFGLPAENAALKNKVPPAQWTYKNIEDMRGQLQRLGFAYDWSREFATCKPEYYRWEQWFFTQLFKKGLVYRKNSTVNWDPVDHTVLANEQVVDGRGWRSGALIERKSIPQWFCKITDYADELLADIEKLEHWPDQVRAMQRNWIGRSEGVNIDFKLAESEQKIQIFTTRPDTLYGVTYIALSPEHGLARLAAETDSDIANFIAECSHTAVAEAAMAHVDKKGIATPFHAIHPLSGEKLPVWIANFVLMNYGSGAVMSVPAHDQRDFEFAQKYKLPIQQVISVDNNSNHCNLSQQAFTEAGVLINSAKFSGLDSIAAKAKISDYLIKQKLAKRQVNYRLRDWGVSRQRYWGTPIPIIYCDDCGAVPVPEKDLPVLLPENVKLDGPGSPLKSIPEFYQTQCPECNKAATRETDTFDTFFESSWYYARFTCPNQDKAMLDDCAKYWTPVDHYVGGIEHAVMHLLYARFFHKTMRDLGLLNSDEPFLKLLTQGMVLKDGAKMSKSKGNTVDPNTLIAQYGADTVRLFSIFAAPPEHSLEWSDSGVEGAARFLRRLWSFAHENQFITELNKTKNCGHSNFDWQSLSHSAKDHRREVHTLLKQARYDFERLQFNTVVSAGMKLLNLLYKIVDKIKDKLSTECQHICVEAYGILLRILAPIAPHITQIIWQELAYGDSILNAQWPKVASAALTVDNLELIVQINGKLRGRITIAVDADKDTILRMAEADTKLQKFLLGKTIKKTILVPGKLINIVVTG